MDTTIYIKLETLLNDLIQNEIDVNAASRKIEQSFSDSFQNKENTNTAYFQEFKTNIYLKDSNGISISTISGKGDIFGDTHSSEGTTISLHDVHNNKSYDLYSDNVFQRQTVSELAKNISKLNEGRENFKLVWDMNTTDPFYLHTMDKSEINSEVIKPLLDNLWIEAYVRHSSEYDEYMISPYGGEDITVHPIAEHFLDLTFQFYHIPKVFEAGKQYLMSQPEGATFASEEIEKLKEKICYVENKETYEILNDLQKKQDIIEFEKIYDNNQSAEIIENEKALAVMQYQKVVTELEALQVKKYTVFDKLKKLPKLEYEHLVEQVQIRKENLDDVLIREQQINKTHEELKSQSDNIQKEIEELREKNNLPQLRIDNFDRVMNHYSENYNSNKLTLEKYQSILKSVADTTLINSLENNLDLKNILTDEVETEIEDEIATSLKM